MRSVFSSARHRRNIGDRSAEERAFELILHIGELGPGEGVVIPQGMPHQATAIGDVPMTCVIAYNSPERQFVLVG